MRTGMGYLVKAALCIVYILGSATAGRSATFAWDPSPDASVPNRISGYKVYYSLKPFAILPADVAVNPDFIIFSVGNQTNAVVDDLLAGATYYVAVTALDSLGGESDISNVLTFRAGTVVTTPAVTLTSPSNNAIIQSSDPIRIAVELTNFIAEVARVDFFDGETLLGSQNSVPFTISKSFVNGSHRLTAQAVDVNGSIVTSAPVTISVNLPVELVPTVTLISPANNATFVAGERVTFTAAVDQFSSPVSKVEFFDGSTLIGVAAASPYSVTSSTLAVGSHLITAKATDDRGNAKTSAAAAITIRSNQTPVVALTSPTANSSFLTNDLVTFTASARDSDGQIARVDFLDGATLLGSKTSSPYTISSALAVGSHTITAKATDNDGATAISFPLTILVQASRPPTVVLTSPSSGATFSTNETITISATASDTDGKVNRVEFFDGATSLGVKNKAPYTISVSALGAGPHSITAKATDNSGVSTISDPAIILVETRNIAPTIAISAPANNSSFPLDEPVTITATAADADGSIATVQFFDGAALLSTATFSPYALTTSTLAAGSHTITAKATDDKGGVTTSAPAVITIRTNLAPVVAITSPASNASFLPNVLITFTASATDADGTISTVEFLDGATLLGTTTSAPFSLDVSTLATGLHTIVARATDNKGAISLSEPVLVTINTQNLPPAVQLLNLIEGSTIAQPFTLQATATDSDGSIARVEFFAGDKSLGVVTNTPYTLRAEINSGTYIFTAKATDNKGASTSSSSYNLSLKPISPKRLAIK